MRTKQTWFAGVHSDVGGGYPEAESALSKYPLLWMIDQARDLPEGHLLERADLAAKKPGTGIPASQLDEVVGRRLGRAVERDTLLSDDDLDTGP